ncbi:MAG: hypothetical protein RIR12_1562 [Bacteroidota bacterium]|jgi:hypothetical protein
MAKTKYDFIKELLEDKKVSQNQRKRILELASKEISIEGTLEERVQKIEDIVFSHNPPDNNHPPTNPSTAPNLPVYIDPLILSKFLRAYNKDSMLKYTCHEIDKDGLITINEKCGTEAFNLIKYQEQITNSFKEHITQFSIPKNIWALINAYLNGGKEWSSDKVKINWQSAELLEWYNNNIGFVPNPDSGLVIENNNLGFNFTPFRSKIFDTTIGSFSQLVIHFKNLFHIRADNSLKKLIENVNAKNDWNERIECSTINLRNNVEFFTDVNKLLQAYKKIITIILDISETHNLGKPEIDLSIKEDENVTLFSIHHKNSTYKKTIKNTVERIGQKHTELIEKLINGVCDLYIQADFENNEFARINIWDGEERKANTINKFCGVEYQLIIK